MIKILKWVGIFMASILALFLLGPCISYEKIYVELPTLELPLDKIESSLIAKEESITDIKPGNHSQISWYNSDSVYQTEYVVLFLHGFSASPMEGMPIAKNLAKNIGANMYAPLMADSGRSSHDSFKGLTPQKMIDVAVEAYAVAQLMGKKVILLSSSTGGTYSAYLASHFPEIHSLIMFSPNIDLADPRSELIIGPWGKQIMNFILPGDYYELFHYTPDQQKYWNVAYHKDGITALKYLVNETMTPDVFSKIIQPVFVGCYYKDEDNQDQVVSISRMRDFFHQINTDSAFKEFKTYEFPYHVLTSDLFNPNTQDVTKDIMHFVQSVLDIELDVALPEPVIMQ